MGESPGIHGRVLGAPLASAGPRNISQAYGQRAEVSFQVFNANEASRGREIRTRPAWPDLGATISNLPR